MPNFNKEIRDWHQPCIVIDVDRTLCPLKTAGQTYADLIPYLDMVHLLQQYKEQGWYIIVHTGRQMRTHNCNLGRILADTLPVLVQWLTKHEIPFDEIWPNKPWCGFNGVYVDDHTITPTQFLNSSWAEIQHLVEKQAMPNG